MSEQESTIIGKAKARQIAGEVRAWMARRERSGRNLAQELGWTEVYLNRRLRGQVPFDVAELYTIGQVLGVPVNRFFEDPDRGPFIGYPQPEEQVRTRRFSRPASLTRLAA